MSSAYSMPKRGKLHRPISRSSSRSSDRTAEVCRRYPLFDCVFEEKYRVRTVNLILSTGLRSLGDKQGSAAGNRNAEVIAAFVPPDFYRTDLISFIKTDYLGMRYRIGPGTFRHPNAFEKYGLSLKRKCAGGSG